MSNHLLLDRDTDEQRSLLACCEFCRAVPGEPCHNEYADMYYCPDAQCDQMYDFRNEALNCVMHCEVL